MARRRDRSGGAQVRGSHGDNTGRGKSGGHATEIPRCRQNFFQFKNLSRSARPRCHARERRRGRRPAIKASPRSRSTRIRFDARPPSTPDRVRKPRAPAGHDQLRSPASHRPSDRGRWTPCWGRWKRRPSWCGRDASRRRRVVGRPRPISRASMWPIPRASRRAAPTSSEQLPDGARSTAAAPRPVPGVVPDQYRRARRGARRARLRAGRRKSGQSSCADSSQSKDRASH